MARWCSRAPARPVYPVIPAIPVCPVARKAPAGALRRAEPRPVRASCASRCRSTERYQCSLCSAAPWQVWVWVAARLCLKLGSSNVNQHRVKDWAMWCSGRSAKASPSLSLPLALEQPEAGTAERRSHKPALEQPQPKTLEHRHDPEVSRNLVSRYAPSSVNL